MLTCLGGICGHTNLFDIFVAFSRGFGGGEGGEKVREGVI